MFALYHLCSHYMYLVIIITIIKIYMNIISMSMIYPAQLLNNVNSISVA
jgi:hypothetical protein